MPTTDDFGELREQLFGLVAQLEDFALPMENNMGPHVLEGGELTDSVYESIKTTRVTALTISGIVAEYAAEAERRRVEAKAAAEAKAAYDDDLADHRRDTALWESKDPQNIAEENRLDQMEEDGGPSDPPTAPPDPPEYIDI
ncbi:MAG: hypothetical protein AAFO29_26285 [Actinomycetota bacterium]